MQCIGIIAIQKHIIANNVIESAKGNEKYIPLLSQKEISYINNIIDKINSLTESGNQIYSYDNLNNFWDLANSEKEHNLLNACELDKKKDSIVKDILTLNSLTTIQISAKCSKNTKYNIYILALNKNYKIVPYKLFIIDT